MTHSGTVPAIAAARARRAVGAMFRFRAWRSSLPVPALVLAGAISGIAGRWRLKRQRPPSAGPDTGSIFSPAHYVTGAALIALAIAYPLFASAGPQDPVGCLGAGILLWASAVWAVTARRVRSPKADTGQE